MMHPTIHLNGTSKEHLIEGWSDAYDALRVARDKMAETGPNGRDYYPQGPDAIYKATEEHMARMVAIQKVMNDLQALCEKAEMP